MLSDVFKLVSCEPDVFFCLRLCPLSFADVLINRCFFAHFIANVCVCALLHIQQRFILSVCERELFTPLSMINACLCESYNEHLKLTSHQRVIKFKNTHKPTFFSLFSLSQTHTNTELCKNMKCIFSQVLLPAMCELSQSSYPSFS